MATEEAPASPAGEAAAPPGTSAASGAGPALPGVGPAAGEAAPDAPPAPGAAAPASPAAPAEPVQQPTQDQPSLLSSAEGKPPETPAPGAEAKPQKTDGSKETKEPPAAKAKDAADPAKDAAPRQPEPAAAPAPLTMSELTVPEGMTIEADGGEKFIGLMNNAELSAKDRAQGLLDLHRAEIERVHKIYAEHQRKTWDDLNAGWRDQLRNDPVIGGNRLHTNLSKAKGMLEEHLPPGDYNALLRHVDANGMGNFPPFIRLLVNLADRLNVFEDGMVVAPPAPPPRNRREPGQRGWYGNGSASEG
jgi:hypothetical protein